MANEVNTTGGRPKGTKLSKGAITAEAAAGVGFRTPKKVTKADVAALQDRANKLSLLITNIDVLIKGCKGYYPLPGNAFSQKFIQVNIKTLEAYGLVTKWSVSAAFGIVDAKVAYGLDVVGWNSNNYNPGTKKGGPVIGELYLSNLKLVRKNVSDELKGLNVHLNAAKALETGSWNAQGTGSGTGTKSTEDKKTVEAPNLNVLDVTYNVGSVPEAYFGVRKGYKEDGGARQDWGGIDDTVGLNSPTLVKQASELWAKGQNNKGMLQTYFPANAWSPSMYGNSAFPQVANLKKYGFQFLYNPASIDMSYIGVAQTDISLTMAGKDRINYIPAVGGSGGISFDVPLNRMYDMRYYNTDGTLKKSAVNANLYSPRTPWGKGDPESAEIFNEQQAIYNKGTMYDVEYLLRTLLGYTMKSSMRHELTADMGVFARRPVELHLGPKLRYRGYVSGLSVRHLMFNERMVPIMSSLHIDFNRYPDYPEAGEAATTVAPLTTTSSTVTAQARKTRLE